MCIPKIWILIAAFVTLAAGFYENSKHVKTLDHSGIFQLQNESTDEVWMVQFYKPSDEKMHNISAAIEVTANSMAGYAKVGAVNIEANALLGLIMGLDKFPAYGFYGYYKHLPDVLTYFDRIKRIQDEVTKQLGYVFEERSIFRFAEDRRNYELGTTDIEYRILRSEMPWGVIFYNPKCEKSLSAKADWVKLIGVFSEVIQFGSVNNPLYQVIPGEDLEYPKVQFYKAGEKTAKTLPENYTGIINYESLYEYFKTNLDEPKPVRVVEDKSAAPCLKKNHCVFAFIPKTEHCGKDCLASNLFNLNSAAKEYKLQSIHWMWNIFDEQPDLEEVFALEQCNHPVLVLINMQIAKYVKVDTDVIRIDVVKKLLEKKHDAKTYPYDITAKKVPDVKNLEDCKREWVKDEL